MVAVVVCLAYPAYLVRLACRACLAFLLRLLDLAVLVSSNHYKMAVEH
jgi:hypothetical protein